MPPLRGASSFCVDTTLAERPVVPHSGGTCLHTWNLMTSCLRRGSAGSSHTQRSPKMQRAGRGGGMPPRAPRKRAASSTAAKTDDTADIQAIVASVWPRVCRDMRVLCRELRVRWCGMMRSAFEPILFGNAPS